MKKQKPEKKRIRHLPALLLCALALTACAEPELYTLRDEAIAAYKEGNYESARALFEEALSHGGGEVGETELDILRYRAECELRLSDLDAFENTLGILTELDPDGNDAALSAEVQKKLEEREKVREAFRVMESGNYEKAYDAMAALADLSGGETGRTAFFNQAVCAEYLGNFGEAYSLFTEYLNAYPDDPEARKEADFLRTRQPH